MVLPVNRHSQAYNCISTDLSPKGESRGDHTRQHTSQSLTVHIIRGDSPAWTGHELYYYVVGNITAKIFLDYDVIAIRNP